MILPPRVCATFMFCAMLIVLGKSMLVAQSQPSTDSDLSQIAQSQAIAGDMADAFATASSMSNDLSRSQTLERLSILRRVHDLPDDDPAKAALGQPGGITANDFQPLIDLVQGVVAPESWSDTGTGLGTIQSFPTGVYVDGSGTLQKIKPGLNQSDSAKNLLAPSAQASTDASTDADPMQTSALRKVSLTRLERQAQLLTAQGKPLSQTIRNLANLTSIQYVQLLPETGDVIIAGPAGECRKDKRGRYVNTQNGLPVLQLDDLVVCLRNARNAAGKFGCAIVPRQKNLAATKQFLAISKLKGNAWKKALRTTLGQQDISVFGIEANTHAAYVLVEADYHMKRVGMGLEPSIADVPSYLDRVQLDANGNPPPMDVARWWFTLNYDNVRTNRDRTRFEFTGPGVRVLSETEFIDAQGQRIHTGNSQGPTKAFAEDFTSHFDQLAAKYPIYQELKNVFDLAVVANLIQQQSLSEKAQWHLTFFAPDDERQFISIGGQPALTYPLATARVPKQVESVMNDRVIRERTKSSTRIHTVVGVSGGVSVDVVNMLKEHQPKVSKLNEVLDARSELESKTSSSQHWWWD